MSAAWAPICVGGLAGSGKTPLRRALEAHPDITMTRHTALWTRVHGRHGDLADPDNLDRCLTALAADPLVAPLAPDVDRLRADVLAVGPATYARLFLLVHAHHAERVGGRRWGEQLDGIERFADEILAAAPRARIIHMVGGAAATWGGAPWRRGHRGREAVRTLGATATARRAHRRHAGAYLVVRHTDLRRDPHRTLARVCTFVGEDLHPAMTAVLEEGR